MLNAATIAAIVAAIWAHPMGQAYLAKIDTIAHCVEIKGNPCCRYDTSQGRITFAFSYDAEARKPESQRAEVLFDYDKPFAEAFAEFITSKIYVDHTALTAKADVEAPDVSFNTESETVCETPVAAAVGIVKDVFTLVESVSVNPMAAAICQPKIELTSAATTAVKPKGVRNLTDEELVAIVQAIRRKRL